MYVEYYIIIFNCANIIWTIFVVTNKPCEAGSQCYMCLACCVFYYVHDLVTLISDLLTLLISLFCNALDIRNLGKFYSVNLHIWSRTFSATVIMRNLFYFVNIHINMYLNLSKMLTTNASEHSIADCDWMTNKRHQLIDYLAWHICICKYV